MSFTSHCHPASLTVQPAPSISHNRYCSYALDFINATSRIKTVCPGVKISGGVSNL